MAKDKEEKPVLDNTIEELGKALDPAIFAGVCVQNKWRKGKRVAKATFTKAVNEFLNAGINGKGKAK